MIVVGCCSGIGRRCWKLKDMWCAASHSCTAVDVPHCNTEHCNQSVHRPNPTSPKTCFLPPSRPLKHSSGVSAHPPPPYPPYPQLPKPDVVLTTFEVVFSDVSALRAVPWSVVVVDQRRRSRVLAGRLVAALQEVAPSAPRVVLQVSVLVATGGWVAW